MISLIRPSPHRWSCFARHVCEPRLHVLLSLDVLKAPLPLKAFHFPGSLLAARDEARVLKSRLSWIQCYRLCHASRYSSHVSKVHRSWSLTLPANTWCYYWFCLKVCRSVSLSFKPAAQQPTHPAAVHNECPLRVTDSYRSTVHQSVWLIGKLGCFTLITSRADDPAQKIEARG